MTEKPYTCTCTSMLSLSLSPTPQLVPTVPGPGQTGRLPLLSTQPPLPPSVMMRMGTSPRPGQTGRLPLLSTQPPLPPSVMIPMGTSPGPGQTGRLPLLSTQPPLSPSVMMPMGTPQQISSYQSLPPSLTAAPPQFQVNPSFAANTQYARMPLQNYVGLPPSMGPIGLGGGGGGSGRKPSKAIRIVDPSTMQEVDLSVSGGAGGNPPPRSVSPANIPIRPPPGGAGSQPSTTAADTFRQQVLEKAQGVSALQSRFNPHLWQRNRN